MIRPNQDAPEEGTCETMDDIESVVFELFDRLCDDEELNYVQAASAVYMAMFKFLMENSGSYATANMIVMQFATNSAAYGPGMEAKLHGYH